MATSQYSTSLNSGNLAKVEGPANLGTFVPLTGWIGSLLLFFFIIKLYHILTIWNIFNNTIYEII